MFWNQVRHVLLKEFAQLKRNPDMLRILFIAPFVQMLAFGYAATTDVKNIPFVLVDQDRSPESRALIFPAPTAAVFRG